VLKLWLIRDRGPRPFFKILSKEILLLTVLVQWILPELVGENFGKWEGPAATVADLVCKSTNLPSAAFQVLFVCCGKSLQL